jgi:outer membrane protein TolC
MTTQGIVLALLLTQAPPAAQDGSPPAAPQQPRVAGPVLTLEEAIREARARNTDLKVIQARLEQSKELHWKAWSAYLPQIVASGTWSHNDFGTVSLPPGSVGPGSPEVVVAKQNQLTGQVQGSQAIFAPQTWFSIASARAGERAAADSLESSRRDILFSVVQAYYLSAGAKQLVGIQERQLAIALAHERDARVRYDAGTAPKVTLLRAEIDRSRAEQDLKRAQNTYVGAKVALIALLDRQAADFEVEIPPTVALPPVEGLEQAALRDRPDVRAAAEQVTANQQGLYSVSMRYLPTLAAFGRIVGSNVAGFTGEQTTWAVGFALNWTILDGFLRESDLREAGARLREAEAARASAQIRAVQEVRTSRLELDSAVANRVKAKEQLDLARETQRLVNVNYKAGAATYLEVTDANSALLTAELTQLSESLNADLAALRLLKAAGAFNPS